MCQRGRSNSRGRAAEEGGETDPSISTIRVIWLYSDVPGKRGRPRKSSTQMQPRDHMSIEAEYGSERMTSGLR